MLTISMKAITDSNCICEVTNIFMEPRYNCQQRPNAHDLYQYSNFCRPSLKCAKEKMFMQKPDIVLLNKY